MDLSLFLKALEIIRERNERYLSLFGSWLDLFDGAILIIIKFEVETQITSMYNQI